VVGISADEPDRNLAWSKELALPFRLLSDVTPAGAVGKRYGVWDGLWRIQRRATFIVDRHGTVRWTESGGVCVDTGRTLDALNRLARDR
jgi:peroxiredoxin (alkyl hydroperoxide reductase subunit C)